MKIKDCMCNSICYCKPDSTIGEVAQVMNKNHIGCMPVCDNTKSLVGIITDRDIVLRALANNKDTNTKVSEIMTTDTVSTENGKLIGILTLGDLAKNAQINNEFVGFTAECICSNNDKNAE